MRRRSRPPCRRTRRTGHARRLRRRRVRREQGRATARRRRPRRRPRRPRRRRRSSTARCRRSPRARSSARSRPSPRAAATPSKELAVKTLIAGDGADGREGRLRPGQLPRPDLGHRQGLRQLLRPQDAAASSSSAQGDDHPRLATRRWSGKKVGSRVELAVPAGLRLRQRRATRRRGIKGTDTLVFVVDIRARSTPKSSAKGKEVAQNDADLPKVGTNTDGKAPSIEVPKGDRADEAGRRTTSSRATARRSRPAETRAACSTRACCGTTRQGVRLHVQRRAARRRSAASRSSRAGTQGLAGKKVGSRVMLVDPAGPGLRRPAAERQRHPEDSTLVFSVDILGEAVTPCRGL